MTCFWSSLLTVEISVVWIFVMCGYWDGGGLLSGRWVRLRQLNREEDGYSWNIAKEIRWNSPLVHKPGALSQENRILTTAFSIFWTWNKYPKKSSIHSAGMLFDSNFPWRWKPTLPFPRWCGETSFLRMWYSLGVCLGGVNRIHASVLDLGTIWIPLGIFQQMWFSFVLVRKETHCEVCSIFHFQRIGL